MLKYTDQFRYLSAGNDQKVIAEYSKGDSRAIQKQLNPIEVGGNISDDWEEILLLDTIFLSDSLPPP